MPVKDGGSNLRTHTHFLRHGYATDREAGYSPRRRGALVLPTRSDLVHNLPGRRLTRGLGLYKQYWTHTTNSDDVSVFEHDV